MSNPPPNPPPITANQTIGAPLPEVLRELAKSSSALTEVMTQYVDKNEKKIGDAVKFVKRAVALMFILVFISGAVVVLASWTLYQQDQQGDRLQGLVQRVDEMATSLDEVQRTAETTQSAVAVAQETIEDRPSVDVEIRPVDPLSSVKPKATAVIVLKPRKTPSASAGPSATPSVEIPIVPSATPKQR